MQQHTNPQHLERWLGPDAVQRVSEAMRGWYGPPIALAGVPGRVYVHGDGDFTGRIRAGSAASAIDRLEDLGKLLRRGWRIVGVMDDRGELMHTAFSSLSAIIAAAGAGRRRDFLFQKVGATGVLAVTNSLWGVGNQPSAGADGSAAPGGRACDRTIAGALPFTNPAGGTTQRIVRADPLATVAGNTLLLYDRLFDVAKTMASTGTEAVTGVPTRYQSTLSTDENYAGGNFLFVEVGGTPLAGTAHNWTVCLYKNQAGAGATLPSMAGAASAIVRRLDQPAGQFFAPLAAGDTGVQALTQMQCDASVATGVINFVIGHPIALIPCPVANMVCTWDGINTAFSLARIFDDACLAFLEVQKPATTATTYAGTFTTIAD